MAEYRPKNQGLERVLGTGALFSTAYGNVGSSIYYALGLVAGFALGMTPVVFLIAGLIFAATAATYAEATTMYPEAGGSASFARRAFNEFWSFFAGWAQMLTYIITIAISAFFVPHYLGVFWEPLGESPADIFAGIAIVVVLGLVNIVGVKESAGVNIGFAVADFLTQVGLVLVGVFLVLDPSLRNRSGDRHDVRPAHRRRPLHARERRDHAVRVGQERWLGGRRSQRLAAPGGAQLQPAGRRRRAPRGHRLRLRPAQCTVDRDRQG